VDGIQKMPPGVDMKAKVKKGSRAIKAKGKAAAQSDVSLDDVSSDNRAFVDLKGIRFEGFA
jgi:hypothetical protein